MAKGVKTGGRDFVKGQSGNPKGPEPLPVEIKELRKLNKNEVELVLNKFLFEYSIEELEVFLEDNTNPVLESFVAQILLKGFKFGDPLRLNFIFERLVGKVKDKVEHSGKITLEDMVTASYSKDGEKNE